ncbi:phage portal protein [Clostridium botulinum]|uniref:Phage portal protein n=1 Tax=Clostridium botulinum TaxID=1491 RepID=A0A6B4JJU8_CLOBO|nr:phage portal protein [Clostridium botulinum]EES47884.1 phage portal protein, HK97 family [Clostridium botulinum E1 str. 'BoNT E Beluga']MBY6760509.1 phage portal protein [Clostridium botulinum]MBY6919416.1 phage portal protein [Clostridium botulinum]MCR1130294.1 phage portal protein [Clostridium botulinum]NFJ56945.1 phage portal protein [Clostridium botulinum]
MGFLMETRADNNQTLQQILNTTIDSIVVNKDTISNISAVYSCLDFITSIIASLDFKLYKKTNTNKLEEIRDDKRLFLLNKEPNYFCNSTQLKKDIVRDMLIDGIGYINVEKNNNEFENLYYVDSNVISVMLDSEAIHKDVIISVQGQEMDISDFIIATLSVKNSIEGNGMLKQNKDLFKLALTLQNYFNKNLESGGGRKGIWKSEGKQLGSSEFAQFKQDAKDIQNTDQPIILNKGLTYTPLTNSNREMQIMENMRFVNEEIIQLFGFPKILNSDTFKTLVKTKINPIINAIENAVDKTLLLESEKEQGYCFKMYTDEIVKADIIERFNAYKLSLDAGIETVNEIRNKENLESVKGMDIHKMTIGQALYNSDDGSWFIPNTGVKMDKEGDVAINGEIKGTENKAENKNNIKLGKDSTTI